MSNHVQDVMKIIGEVMASHVMARATFSVGAGRLEETLTADLADLFRFFNVTGDYLQAKGAGYLAALHVAEITKRKERKIGADFAILLRVLGPTPEKDVRKLVLIQAKREDYHSNGKWYAASRNHAGHAQNMIAAVGPANAFFAFYHSNQVAASTSIHLRPSQISTQRRPRFVYITPEKGSTYYYESHPNLNSETFIEPSAYRDLARKYRRSWDLPIEYSYGIVIVGADHTELQQKKLPPTDWVLKTGVCFSDFLGQLVTCQLGENLPNDREIARRLNRVLGNIEELGDFSFLLDVEYISVESLDRAEQPNYRYYLEYNDYLNWLPGLPEGPQ